MNAETPQEAARRLAESRLREGYRPEALHTWSDAEGSELYHVIRLRHPESGDKWMRPIHLNGQGYKLGKPPTPDEGWPLYRVSELLDAEPQMPVFVVEGEACADALMARGILATTSGSATSADGADWSALSGRRIIVWPDHDDPGLSYAKKVAEALEGVATSVEIIEPRALDLAEGGDAVDWLSDHPDATADDVLALPRLLTPETQTDNVQHTAWPILIPLDTPAVPPLSNDCLPDWAGEYARALAAASETPLELAVSQILGAASVACARRLMVIVDDAWREPCNLWMSCWLPPGNRKSTVHEAAVSPLRLWEAEAADAAAPAIAEARSHRAIQDARIAELVRRAGKSNDRFEREQMQREAAGIQAELCKVPEPPMLWTSDCTPERLGALMADQGECMAWMSAEGGIFDMLAGRYSKGIPNLDLVLKAHAGDADRVDRGSRPRVYLGRPRLSLALSPQPSILEGLAARPGFEGRGLLARLLYFVPPSPLGFRDLSPRSIAGSVTAAYDVGIRTMLDWPASGADDGLHIVRLTPGARAELHDYQHLVESMMRPDGDMVHMTGWASKAPGAAARIAAVLHGIEHVHSCPWDEPIARDTMSRALDLVAVITRHSIAAHDQMGASREVEDARHVWRSMKRYRLSQCSVRDLYQVNKGRFPRMAQLTPAIDLLRERGYIDLSEVERVGRGRPPSPLVIVRPDIEESWA